MDERSTTITIGGTEYELILTTRATKEIAKKYGDINKLGDVLSNTAVYDDDFIWLLVLLANQSVAIYNLLHKDNPKEPLTIEQVELLTTPFEMSTFENAIVEAIHESSARYVKSEDNSTKK